jgi:hypothetical protein
MCIIVNKEVDKALLNIICVLVKKSYIPISGNKDLSDEGNEGNIL